MKTFLLAFTGVALTVAMGCSDDTTQIGTTATTGAGASGGMGGGATIGAGGSGGDATTGVGGANQGGAGPGGASQGGAGQGAGGGGGGGMCPPEPGDDACTACVKTNCCPESTACLADAECGACLTCLQAATNPQQQGQCFLNGDCNQGDAETSAFLTCAQGSCAADCQ